MLPVVEIFDSIDGEGVFAGKLATFIRLAGCNLRCRYCDTKYALMELESSHKKSVDDVLEQVEKFGNKHVTLTGGEPLLHHDVVDLVNRLCDLGFHVNVETNGTQDISWLVRNYDCTVTMDYKTPSSFCESFPADMKRDALQKMHANMKLLRPQDALKIVMRASDFNDVWHSVLCNALNGFGKRSRFNIFLSPIFGECEPRELVDFLKSLRKDVDRENLERVRVQLQMHKFIWPPEMRGV